MNTEGQYDLAACCAVPLGDVYSEVRATRVLGRYANYVRVFVRRAIWNSHEHLLDLLLDMGVCLAVVDSHWMLIDMLQNKDLCSLDRARRMLALGASPFHVYEALWRPRLCNLNYTLSLYAIIQHARTRWTRATHRLYPPGFRARVFAFLCANHRVRIHRDVIDIIIQHMCAMDEEDAQYVPKTPPGSVLEVGYRAVRVPTAVALYGNIITVGGRGPRQTQVSNEICLQHIPEMGPVHLFTIAYCGDGHWMVTHAINAPGLSCDYKMLTPGTSARRPAPFTFTMSSGAQFTIK
jgi:hypothetical protein